jgi:hypothetical protein
MSHLKRLKQSDLVEEYLVPHSPVREYYSMMGAIAVVPEHECEVA